SGFCSVPSNPSNVADFGYSFPNMLSNERFSSMSTTMWSICPRLISSQTGAKRWFKTCSRPDYSHRPLLGSPPPSMPGRIPHSPSSMRGNQCLCNDCRFKALALSRRGVEKQIDGHLDLVTAILARPDMTDFVVAHVCRPLWCDQ